MDNNDELQELDLDAIMREFHDPENDEPEETSDAETERPLPEELTGELPPDLPEEELPEEDGEEGLSPAPEDVTDTGDTRRLPEIPPEEDADGETGEVPEEDAPDPGETRRIDDLSSLESGGVEDTDPAEDEAAGGEEPEEEKEPPIPFDPHQRLHLLKKKLIAGPEKRYYAISEIGVGKLQIAIIINLVLVVLCLGGTALYALRMVPENRLRLITYSQVLAMLVSALLGCYQLMDGLGSLFRGRFNINTMLSITFLACCADAVFCLEELRVPCCAAFCFEVSMALWGRYHRRSTEMSQMDTLRKAPKLCSVVKVPSYYENMSGILRGEGDVDDFMDTYNAPSGPERVQSVYCLVSLLICIGISVVAGMLHGLSMGVQIFSTSLLVAIPASFFISLTRPAAVLERRLHLFGSVLCGWQGVRKLAGNAVYPIRDTDLFPAGTTKLNGVKFYGERNSDEVVSYATSLISVAGGSLVPVFRNMMNSRGGETAPVDEFQDYGCGGIGGIIGGEPVLLGTLEFIEDMGVKLPEGTAVSQAVYCAIGGELCAVFAVSYAKMRSSSAGLVSLCGCRSITPMILSDDFMITESFIGSKFAVSTRRIVFPDQAVKTELRSKTADPETDVLALSTRDDLASTVYTVTGAKALRTASKLGVAIHLIGGIVGMLVMMAVAYLGTTELLTPINILLYQFVWAVPGILITEWTRSV